MIKTVATAFFVCLIAIFTAYADDSSIVPGEKLSLKKAIEIALRNHPSIEAQQGQVQVNEAKVGQIRGDLLPRLSLGSAYTRISPVDAATAATTSNAGLPSNSQYIPTGSDGTYDQYAATGNISLLIFDFGKTWANLRAQKANTQAAQYDLQESREQVIMAIKEAYYSLLSALGSRDVAAEKVEQFKKHLVYAQALYSTGSKSKLDVTKAEVDLNNARVDLIKAENGVRYFRLSLNNALGLPSAPVYTVEEDLSIVLPALNYEDVLQKAYSQRPDLLALQKQKESAEQSIKAAQRAHYPIITGNAGYVFVGTEFPVDHGWTAGVNISIPIFNGLTTSYKIAENRANLTIINARIKELRQKIALELEQGFLALRESSERRQATQVVVRQAKENLDLATERYVGGLAIAVEVADAIFSHANAQLSNISAHYDQKIALARIDKAMGGNYSEVTKAVDSK